MRQLVRLGLVVACLVAGQSAAFAQATLAGIVRDTSGARAARRDRRGGEPGAHRESPYRGHRWHGPLPHREPAARRPTRVTFTLAGFATVKRETWWSAAPAVIAIDGETAGRRRAGDGHRHRRDAGGRRADHEARSHARQRDHAQPAERPQLQLPAHHRSRAADEQQQRQHRSGVRDLPDPRRPRRRIAPDGRGPEHQQPARRQPAVELRRRHRQRARK